MENVIRSSTPTGSVILAYGAPAPIPRFPKILALVAGFFGVLSVILIALFIFVAKVPVPHDVAVLAFVRPEATIPASMPQVWRDAQTAAKPFPVFVGLSGSTETGFVPFAIVPRTTKVEQTQKNLLWSLTGTNNEQAVDHKGILSLSGKMTDYLAPSWVALTPSHFIGTADTEVLAGPIHENRWEPRMDAPESSSERVFAGDALLNINAFPESWQIVTKALETEGFYIPSSPRPDAIRWSAHGSSTSFALDFKESLSSTDRITFAAAAGLYDKQPFTLPDGTIAMEFHPPVELLANSATTTWNLEDGRRFELEDREVRFSEGEMWPQTQIPDRCPGSPLLVLPAEALMRLGTSFGLPIETKNAIYWMTNDGGISVCW